MNGAPLGRMIARLTHQEIDALDQHAFSVADKKWLAERYATESSLAPWQEQLKREWPAAKRWGAFLVGDGLERTKRFRATHKYCQLMAGVKPPTKVGRTVTDFTSWVYSLYTAPPRASSLRTGKDVERQVARFANAPVRSGWDLIFEDPLHGKPTALKSSGLLVCGAPLYGAPDLVFRESATGRVLIVERKASNRVVCSDGWPNLRCQLWAYSKIDLWWDAPEIILIGEVWGFGPKGVIPRAALRWNTKDQAFMTECAQLFELYAQACARLPKA